MPDEAIRISVIVPCHTVEGYVEACLASLEAQTHDSFEVICIDDGSTDATGALLDAQAQKDERFKVIHQSYRGPSAARNVGVAQAQGALLAFVDGDDVVSECYLSALERLLKEEDADIACCDHTKVVQGEALQLVCDDGLIERMLTHRVPLTSQEALEQIALDRINLAFWAKLFKRELIEAHPFPEGKVYEDLWNLGRVVADATKIVMSSEKLYYYVSRENSITRARPVPVRYFFQFREAIEQFESIYAANKGLAHATDDKAYCIHLVHRLCGLYGTLQKSVCSTEDKAVYTSALLDELDAACTLARTRGVSPTSQQMIRAKILMASPVIHDVLLSLYRTVKKS